MVLWLRRLSAGVLGMASEGTTLGMRENELSSSEQMSMTSCTKGATMKFSMVRVGISTTIQWVVTVVDMVGVEDVDAVRRLGDCVGVLALDDERVARFERV